MSAQIRNSGPYKFLAFMNGMIKWSRRRFAAPSPAHVKQTCLIRNGIPNAIWIETGTYTGSTTRILSKHSKMVYSIEPAPSLYASAKRNFRHFKNVEIINGTSEEVFPTLLPRIQGDVNFWLDGHYSSGATFKGPKSTPIDDELKSISENLPHFKKVAVLVDDIRCFNPKIPEYSDYPSVDLLVDWARANRLHWHIEHDIFVAKN